MPRVAIVGGGITGLGAAYFLERLTDLDIDLYEKDDRLGGKISSNWVDGFLVEGSADSIFLKPDFPELTELVSDLGLEDQVVRPSSAGFYMLVSGRLWRVPRELASFNSVTPEALNRACFLSEEGKARAALEPSIPPGSGEEESIAGFFRRRFGEEFSRLVAEPLLAGTHSGRPEELSMTALFPRYVQMERDYGSLGAGPTQVGTGQFFSFRDGIQALPDGLASGLRRTGIHLSEPVSVSRNEPCFKIGQGSYDSVVVALPAHAARCALGEASPDLANELGGFEAASGVVVTLGFDSSELASKLTGTGFLVPYEEPGRMRGATFSSSKWPGRSPEGSALVRVFLKDGPGDAVDDALDGLGSLFDLGAPVLTRVDRWAGALPLYKVGHDDRMARVQGALLDLPNLFLAGQSYAGVGISDCLRQGREAAVKIANSL